MAAGATEQQQEEAEPDPPEGGEAEPLLDVSIDGVVLLAARDEAGVYCGMCLERQPSGVRSCCYGHQWCRPCLAGYVGSEIACNELAVRCPWIGEEAALQRCNEVIDEATITALVDADTAARYHRFKALSDPLMRECPLPRADGTPCRHLQRGSARAPAMTCEQCHGAYCFAHANAHPGETCRAYEKRQKAVTKANSWYIKQISKTCPQCKAPTQKASGCIHMTCSQCRTHWCWVCGTKVAGGGSDHFSPFNPFGCGVAMMLGDFTTTSYERNVVHFMALAAARVAIAPFYFFAIAAAVPTFLLLSILCLPSICYPCFFSRKRSFYGGLWTLLFGSEEPRVEPLPVSVVLFFAGYWPLALVGLLTMLALSPVLLVCCGWRRGRCSHWFQRNGSTVERLLHLHAGFSLWPCVLSLGVLFVVVFVGLSPLTLVYGLLRAPRSGAQLDLPT